MGGSTTRIILAFGLVGAVTSPFMSNTGGAAMILPIALGVMASVGGWWPSRPRGTATPSGCGSAPR